MSIAATLPKQLDDLRGEIYRLLPPYEAEDWRQRFDDAAEHADLHGVWPQFALWLLINNQYGVIQYARTERQHTLIANATIGGPIDCDAIFKAAVHATSAGYAAAYSDNSAAIRKSAYPAGYALYTAAHIAADRADLAATAHATAHFAAGRTDAAQAQAAELIRLMEAL